MVRALVTGVNPDTDASVFAGGARIPGANADVSDEIIPALTLSYFFTDNLGGRAVLLLRQARYRR